MCLFRKEERLYFGEQDRTRICNFQNFRKVLEMNALTFLGVLYTQTFIITPVIIGKTPYYCVILIISADSHKNLSVSFSYPLLQNLPYTGQYFSFFKGENYPLLPKIVKS